MHPYTVEGVFTPNGPRSVMVRARGPSSHSVSPTKVENPEYIYRNEEFFRALSQVLLGYSSFLERNSNPSTENHIDCAIHTYRLYGLLNDLGLRTPDGFSDQTSVVVKFPNNLLHDPITKYNNVAGFSLTYFLTQSFDRVNYSKNATKAKQHRAFKRY